MENPELLIENPDFNEAIIASSGKNITLYNANTWNSMKVFTQEIISPKCLALLSDDYFVGAVMNKPQIVAWPTNDKSARKKVVSPCGVISALATTSNGSYVVASIKEQIRVWDVKSGEMLAAFSRHYQAVTCLRFTSDDSMFLSGGKDGIVFVWMLSSVTSENSDQERIKPFRTWNNHSKEVTDIFIGWMGIYSRVATTSSDMTCKIYELDSGILLTTICMDEILTTVVMDPLEYYVLFGTEKGIIYKVNLYEEQPRELHCNTMKEEKVNAHLSKVNSLSISVAGDKLLSSSDKTLKVWDMGTLSCLFKFPIRDDIITNAFFAPYPCRIEPSFSISQLNRIFDRSQQPSHRKLKVQHLPLTLLDDGKNADVIATESLMGYKVRGNLEKVSNPTMAESLFQEAFKEETVFDVRKINSQLYTYLVKNVFDNMEASENAEEEEEEHSE